MFVDAQGGQSLLVPSEVSAFPWSCAALLLAGSCLLWSLFLWSWPGSCNPRCMARAGFNYPPRPGRALASPTLGLEQPETHKSSRMGFPSFRRARFRTGLHSKALN